MHRFRGRVTLARLVAGALLVAVAFAACSDALITAPRVPRPRPDAIPLAEVSADPVPILVAAGDIADCSSTGDEATSRLLDSLQFDAILVMGDLAYQDGTATEFANCYGPTWGRHKAKTRPTPGNHEYHTTDARGYFGYFGAAATPAGESYYSFNLGAWHILSLNSNISASASSEQVAWVRQDLAANPTACSLAFWHHPVISSGEHGNSSRMAEMWRVLDSAGVDVVLAGHDHNYERFAPQTATGIGIATGLREFVVGTGGRKLRSFSTVRDNSEVRNNDSWGVLKLTLNATSYDWQFVPVAGGTLGDQGTANCVQTGPPEPNQQPVVTLTAPSDGATFTAPATITVSATASDADGNLNRVDFFRGSTLIGSDATPPYSVTWRNADAGTYTFKARAVDAAEAWTASEEARVTVNAPANSAPTVSLDAPLDDAEFVAPATITLRATAADVDGNLSRVEFYQGTTLLGTATASPYTFTWTGVAAGSYVLTARAIDAGGETTTSDETRITVNTPPPPNSAPTISLDAPADGATFNALATITLSATAADPDAGDAVVRVEFLNGTTVVGAATTSPYTFTWSNVPAGSYTVTARAIDGSGAIGTSAPAQVTVNPPSGGNVPPVANPGGPYTGTEGVSLTLNGAGSSDANGDALTYAWDFGDGTTSTEASPAKTYADNGTYTVRLVVSDAAGASHSATTTAKISNATPTLTLVWPATVESGQSYTLSITDAMDAPADKPGLEFRFECSGAGGYTPWGSTPSTTCQGITGPATGTVRGAVRDKDGATRQQSRNTEFLAPRNNAPTVSLTAPLDGASFTAPAGITLEANAADADGNLSRVEFYQGTTLLGAATASPYSFAWTGVAVGAYTLTARAIDAAGASATSAEVRVTVVPPNQPPVANAGGPYSGTEGVALSLSGGASTDPESAPLTYSWNFGDGTTGSGVSPSKTYADNGTYSVTLVVSDPAGASHSATTTVAIVNASPTATFAAPASAASGQAYTLAITNAIDVAADLPGLQYQFDCGDGFGAWGAAASASCAGVAGPASRAVRGAVRDKDGGVREFAASVDILAPPNQPPVANAGGPYTGTEGISLALSGGGSTDPNGDALTYAWTFGDGTTGNGPTPTKTYGDNGTYTITLVVSDPAGATHSATTTVTIANAPPLGLFAAPATVQSGAAYTLAISDASDVAADLPGLEYRFECGVGFTPWSAAASVSCPGVTGPATRVVRGAIRDKDGDVRQYSQNLEVLPPPNQPPVASAGGPYSGSEGVGLAFNGSASSDPEGATLAYAWDFGDGTTGTGVSPSKVYGDNGTYTVTLVVTDPAGASHGATATVTIANVAPVGTFVAPATVESGATYTLEITGATDAAADRPSLEYQFDCGAGSGGWSAVASASCPGITGPATRAVRGAVRDKDGGVQEFSGTVSIAAPPNQPPIASAGGPYAGTEGLALALNGAASTDPNGDVLTYAWDFGDGTSGSGVSPTKVYGDNGGYTITLVVTDPAGANHSATATVTIANAIPTGTFAAPAMVASDAAYNVAITGAADVAADRPGLEYRFDCGAGYGGWGPASSRSCAGIAGPATRTVRGAVRDKDGGVREYSDIVDVLAPANSAPSVALTTPVDGASFTAEATITVSAIAGDVDGNLSRVEFYQGTTLLGSATSSPYSFTWTSVPAGSYTLTARAVDAAGAATSSSAIRVTVNAAPPSNQPPVANAGGPYSGTEGVALALDGGGSADPEGSQLTYAWSFGDGTTGSGRSPSKVYADNGTYTITLVVADPAGASHSTTTTATIANRAPAAALSALPASVNQGSAFTLALDNASDAAADLPSLQFGFDCGDGAGLRAFASTSALSCATVASGARAVRGVVRDKEGVTTEYTASVPVANVAPSVTIVSAPSNVNRGSTFRIDFRFSDPGAQDGAWSYTIDWGDGQSSGPTSVATQGGLISVTHRKQISGTVVVTVRVTDKGGATGQVLWTLNVSNDPPVSRPGGPYTGPEGVALTLNGGSSSDPDGDQLTYNWTFGDGTTGTGASPSKTYADNGTYTITLVVYDPDGEKHSATATATIANALPTGTFSSPATVASGAAYSLAITDASDASADRPGLEYQFDCGAGFGAWGAAASTTCPAVTGPVARAVRGAIRDKDGGVRQFSGSIDVLAPPNTAPSVSLTAPLDGATFTAPAAITLGAMAADVDGNLSRVEFYSGATLLGSDASAPYAFAWTGVAAGIYSVTARAIDVAGAASTSAAARVTVNAPPVANAGGPYTRAEGVALTIDGGASTDPEGGQLTYTWNFGDGTTAVGRSPSKVYGDNGTYTITLVVSDPLGASHSATTTASISNVVPTGTFVSPATVGSGEQYTLAVTSVTDATGDRPSLEYRFDCGAGFGAWGAAASTTCSAVTGPATRAVRGAVRDKDGGTREFSASVEIVNVAPSVSLTEPLDGATFSAPATVVVRATASDVDGNLSRVEFYNGATLLGSVTASPYSLSWSTVPAGNYVLTARAIDAAGASTTSAQARVTVTNSAPASDPGGPYSGAEGVAVTFDGGRSSDANGDALAYAWDFGDGTTSTGRSPSKVYADNGTFTVTLVVSDPLGASHSATTTVTIANVAPTGTLVAPTTVDGGVGYALAITNAADVAADLSVLEYRFDCGGGYSSWDSASSVSCPAVAAAGLRPVRGAVRDKDAGVREYTASVDILNLAPTVSLTAPVDGASFTAPATIALSANAEDVNGNLSRVEFYRGSTLLGSATSTPYSFTWTNAPAGSYTLTARAVDAAGASATSAGARVTVVNGPPVAHAGGPYAGSEGVALTLDGGGSTDPNGDALAYAWTFGDGTTGTGRSPSKTYGDNGTYTITLVVTDPSGASHSATATATIVNVDPTLTFVAPTSVQSGQTFTVEITNASDVAADQPTLEYRFNCGGGYGPWGSASSATCAASAGPATRTVRGEVRDKDGGTRQQSRNVEILNSAPSVSLTAPADGLNVAAPATIGLTASASDIDGNLSRVEFYNGTTLLATDTSEPYSFTWSAVPAGSYVLTARAIDAAGAVTNSAAARVTVVNAPPVANAGGPYSGNEGAALALDGGGSTDPNGDALTYSWDFGDGTTASGRSPSKAYADNGTYTVTLTVSDPAGATHTVTTTATIANVPPMGTFTAPTTVESGASYTLAISNASDVGADLAGLEYWFDCGNGFTVRSAASSTSCTGGPGPATRAVRAALRDKDGGVREFSADVQILNAAPTVSLTEPADGASFVAPATISLSASASDADGNLSRVEFYNGTTLLGSDATAPYTFTWSGVAAGSYVVTARAVDAEGVATTSTQAQVTVSNTPPVANAGGPYTANEGVALTLDGRASSDPNGDALAYAWSFGDGTTGTGASPSKTYADNGTYTVTLTVSDPLGATHTATATVTIANVAPTGTFAAPSTVNGGAAYTLAITGASDVAADQAAGFEYRFDCGSGFAAWGSASSLSCPAVSGAATRTVRGEVRDRDGGVRPFSASVTILNRVPVSNAGGPYSGSEGVALTVNGGGSSDPDGEALTYAWSFGDGTTATGASPSKTYADNGTFTITLTVTDPLGATHSATTTATIVNVVPTGSFSAPASVASGAAYTLAITGASDVAADVPGLEYQFDCGTGYSAWGTASSLSCAGVGGPATRAVRGAVRDKDGGVREYSGNVDVLPPPAYFLVIDQSSISEGGSPNDFSESEINGDLASYAMRQELRYFAANAGRTITLYSGSTGSEGFHAVKTIPSSWNSAGPTADGLRNYLLAGPGLGSPNTSSGQGLLSGVPDVTPLRATGLRLLIGQPVCALVRDGNVSTSYNPLRASLTGRYLGIVAFVVNAVTPRSSTSTTLPAVNITIRDADAVCGGALQRLMAAPAPTSSSSPNDTGR